MQLPNNQKFAIAKKLLNLKKYKIKEKQINGKQINELLRLFYFCHKCF